MNHAVAAGPDGLEPKTDSKIGEGVEMISCSIRQPGGGGILVPSPAEVDKRSPTNAKQSEGYEICVIPFLNGDQVFAVT